VESNLARKLPQAQPLWQQFVSTTGIHIVPCPRKSITGINAKDAPVVSAAVSAAAIHFVARRLLQLSANIGWQNGNGRRIRPNVEVTHEIHN